MNQKLRDRLKRLSLFFTLALAAFLLLEGLSSSIYFLRAVAKSSILSERAHTRYDKELGWSHIPDLFIKDMYGRGLDLSINSQGFRGRETYSQSVPNGKTRIITSGDSFTLGLGVADDAAWGQQLASGNDCLQVVNMGQSGYGIDQAYLWYMRDGIKLEHDIHIFAFIQDDLRRMKYPAFHGYGRPVLRMQNGKLVTENVPVPRRAISRPRLTYAKRLLKHLSTAKILRSLLRRLSAKAAPGPVHSSDNEIYEVMLRIFESLDEVNKRKNSVLVVVYLPAKDDRLENGTFPLRKYLQAELAARRILFVDAAEEFDQLSKEEFNRLFLRGNAHYTKEGQKLVADILRQRLLAFPETAEKAAQ
ncbi:MAG: hypothetical protein ABIJ96_02670 [Elusimicrobiota bacterium]